MQVWAVGLLALTAVRLSGYRLHGVFRYSGRLPEMQVLLQHAAAAHVRVDV